MRPTAAEGSDDAGGNGGIIAAVSLLVESSASEITSLLLLLLLLLALSVVLYRIEVAIAVASGDSALLPEVILPPLTKAPLSTAATPDDSCAGDPDPAIPPVPGPVSLPVVPAVVPVEVSVPVVGAVVGAGLLGTGASIGTNGVVSNGVGSIILASKGFSLLNTAGNGTDATFALLILPIVVLLPYPRI